MAAMALPWWDLTPPAASRAEQRKRVIKAIEQHPHLELQVHTTTELEDELGDAVVSRRQLHLWPLSSVELLETRRGDRWIYKAQLAPTVECDFYEAVTSTLLPAHRVLTRTSASTTSLIAYIDGPLLRDLQLSDGELADHASQILLRLGDLPETAPTFLDFGSRGRWWELVDGTLELVGRLASEGKVRLDFPLTSFDDIRAWSRQASVVRLIERTSRLIHGDLNEGNVFVTGDGYRVIDWQRPAVGPADIDTVALFEHRPAGLRAMDRDVVGCFAIMRIHWAANSRAYYLPQLEVVYDLWINQAVTMIPT